MISQKDSMLTSEPRGVFSIEFPLMFSIGLNTECALFKVVPSANNSTYNTITQVNLNLVKFVDLIANMNSV